MSLRSTTVAAGFARRRFAFVADRYQTPPMSKEPPAQTQLDKFRDAARELQTNDDPDRFAETVRKLAKAPPAPAEKPKKAASANQRQKIGD